jgi:hypothetical protein
MRRIRRRVLDFAAGVGDRFVTSRPGLSRRPPVYRAKWEKKSPHTGGTPSQPTEPDCLVDVQGWESDPLPSCSAKNTSTLCASLSSCNPINEPGEPQSHKPLPDTSIAPWWCNSSTPDGPKPPASKGQKNRNLSVKRPHKRPLPLPSGLKRRSEFCLALGGEDRRP